MFQLSPDQLEVAKITVLVAVLASYGLWRNYRQGALATAAGGAHLNVALFTGIGGLSYVWYAQHERLTHSEVLLNCIQAGRPFLAGYAIWLVIDETMLRRFTPLRFDAKAAVQIPPALLVFFFGVGMVSTLICRAIIASSGLLIIFQVLKNLTYPVLTLVLIRCAASLNSTNIAIIAVTSCAAGLSAFISPWRSDLVLFGGCFFLAFVLMKPRFKRAAYAVGLTAVFIIAILPFLQAKKKDPLRFQRDPAGMLFQSQMTPIGVRFEMLVSFLGMRVDSLREMAYVERAVHHRVILLRNGESYEEAILQMIPRFFWPSKPSYNNASGGWLPRIIGLLGMEDKSTSWGVNVYAEAIWNFGSWQLLWFVPAYFFFVRCIDWSVLLCLKNPVMRTVAECQLFFLTFQIVGLVNAMTYIVWTVLLAWVFESTLLQSFLPAGDSK